MLSYYNSAKPDKALLTSLNIAKNNFSNLSIVTFIKLKTESCLTLLYSKKTNLYGAMAAQVIDGFILGNQQHYPFYYSVLNEYRVREWVTSWLQRMSWVRICYRLSMVLC